MLSFQYGLYSPENKSHKYPCADLSKDNLTIFGAFFVEEILHS